MILYKYALLNPGRKKKQTLFTLLCISVSTLIILADFALINGMQARFKEAVNRVMSGQLTVYSSAKENINILEAQLTEQSPFTWNEVENRAFSDAFPELEVNQRARIGSLIALGDETSYVSFHALEGGHLEKVNSLLTFIDGGLPRRENDIVIGESVADDIKCTVGDTVLLVATNVHDYMSDAIGVVSGIFEERGIAIYLGYNGFMPLDAGKILAGTEPENALELVVNPKDERDLSAEETAAIRRWFDTRHPGLQLAPWDETAPLLHSVISVWQGFGMMIQVMFILFSLIILITLTSLVIRSRTKEFGTLRAIGFPWWKIKWLVCGEYAVVCTVSVLAGYGLLELMLAVMGGNGMDIASEDMQSALMTDNLLPYVEARNLLHVWVLFLATMVLSTLISIRRMQKRKIQSLLND